MADTVKMKEFIKLTLKKRELAKTVKELNAEIEEIGEALLDEMAFDEMQSVSVAGWVIYIDESVWAKPLEDRDALVRSLQRNGHADITTINASSLSGLVREWLGEKEGKGKLPRWAKKVIGYETRKQVRMRKAAKK